LPDFLPYNGLKIINTFFRHERIHGYIWSEPHYVTIIDYIISNKKLDPLVE